MDEVVGFHLERAFRYRVELGPADDVARRLSTGAAERLATAGLKAVARADMRAATSLLSRAAELYPPDDPRRLRLLPSLGRALHDAGDWDRAESILSEAVSSSLAAGDRRTAADGTVALTHLRLFRGSFTSHASIRSELAGAVEVFEELDDEAGLGRALGIAGQLRFWAGEAATAIEELERAAGHARNADDRFHESQSLAYVLVAMTHGPTPVESALERAEQIAVRAEGDRQLEVSLYRCRSYLEAMRGDFDAARGLVRAGIALCDELGLTVSAIALRFEAGRIERLAGRPDLAELVLRPAVESLELIGDRGHFVTVAPVLADVLLALGHAPEAERLIGLTIEWAIDDDIDPQISWRRAQARLLAERGDLDEAERVAREAVALGAGTDYLDDHAEALEALAKVLSLQGRPQQALAQLDEAIHLQRLKGNVVSAARAEVLRDELRGTAPAVR